MLHANNPNGDYHYDYNKQAFMLAINLINAARTAITRKIDAALPGKTPIRR